MKLSKEKEQEYKAEFSESFGMKAFEAPTFVMHGIHTDEIADFWINKINTELERRETKILESIKKVNTYSKDEVRLANKICDGEETDLISKTLVINLINK